ncbi:MAG: hypothetical protein ACC707_07085 [Thiohalomonadales bacterium]
MAQQDESSGIVGSYTRKQQLFVRYFTFILIDLTVLNLFNEYWDWVSIESFTVSMAAAILLQLLLKITLNLEHRVAAYYNAKLGKAAKVKRWLYAYLILVVSKLIILEAINLAFGDLVKFTGPYHGLVSFVVVVTAILAAELVITKYNQSLGLESKDEII